MLDQTSITRLNLTLGENIIISGTDDQFENAKGSNLGLGILGSSNAPDVYIILLEDRIPENIAILMSEEYLYRFQ